MDFTVLIGNRTCCRICDDPHHDLIKVGTPLDKEVVEAFKNNVLTVFEFGQFERARTNNILVVAGVGFHVFDFAVAIDVFRNDRHQLARHRQHQCWMRSRQVQDSCVRIRCANAFHRREHGFEGVVCFDDFNGKRDIFRR